MFWFNKKQKNYLGLDIGASSIKLVDLKKKDERYHLKNYSIVHLGKLAKVGKQEDEDILKEKGKLIKKAIKEAGIDSKKANLSVPVYSSFSILINFPSKMPKSEIASAVKYEAKKYVPVSISEVALDWSLIPSYEEDEPQRVLLVAVPKEIIDYYNQIAKLAGIKVEIIEGESFSLVRSLIGNDKSSMAIIDWGFHSINVTVVDQGYIRGVHNLENGGLKITRAISDKFGFSLDKAEDKKISLSEKKDDSLVKNIINKELEDVLFEIKKIIDSYQSRKGKKIEKFILSGGSAKLYGLADLLSGRLNAEVSIGDPFARVSYSSNLKPLIKKIGPSLAVAVGLAMKD